MELVLVLILTAAGLGLLWVVGTVVMVIAGFLMWMVGAVAGTMIAFFTGKWLLDWLRKDYSKEDKTDKT